MKRSTDRFLTTHTGSLPRPGDLIRAMFAREEGVPVDAGALAARVRTAVAEVVSKQVAAGKVDPVVAFRMRREARRVVDPRVEDRIGGEQLAIAEHGG